jgi:cyclic beta-1,2-glucan synthetase
MRNPCDDGNGSRQAKANLRAAALAEAARWSASQTREPCRLLEKHWQDAAEALRRVSDQQDLLAPDHAPAAQDVVWLVDNLAFLGKALQQGRTTLKDARALPQVENSARQRLPRVYTIARGYLRATDFILGQRTLAEYLTAVQTKNALQAEELWAIKPMIQLALIEQIGKNVRTLLNDPQGAASLQEPVRPGELATLILSLRKIGELDWRALFQETSPIEEILRGDPAEAYPQMDFESRDAYRQAVAELARRSGVEERDVARKAIALACAAQTAPAVDPRQAERRSHVGYYLVDQGRKLLEKDLRYHPPLIKQIQAAILTAPALFYLGGIALATLSVTGFLLSGLGVETPLVAGLILLLLPATDAAVGMMNQLTTVLLTPRKLHRLDFSKGIPADCTTMVVVPTLLLNEEHTRQMVKDLEIRYLANRDANLHFALLTDSPDSFHPFDENNQLVDLCSTLIQELNNTYAGQGKGTFFLLHRHRSYNAAEGKWMGWERKRGKLLDFNNLLRNHADNFPVKIGDLSVLARVRYVITLDSDTQLPKDSAHKLVGTLAHPLNRAVVDAGTNTVVEGYGVLQPRIAMSVRSSAQSRLASLYSGETVLDNYAHAVSDVYQDLFGEGSYAGKGIYDVDVFQQVLARRFPCNVLLSHDLIEGNYTRVGLVSDIELIDDCPSHFSAYSRRKHRWIRGDWQILWWLFPRVPDYFGNRVPNPLSLMARWKILDNLRRSLSEIATFWLLIGGWFFLPGSPVAWTAAALVLMVMPAYLQLFLAVFRHGISWKWGGFWSATVRGFIDRQVQVFLTLALLSHQALVTADAIVRTLVRLTLTHKKLLEWETAAQSELRFHRKTPVDMYLDWTPWLSLTLGVALALRRPEALPPALLVLGLWGLAKPFCRWLNRPAFEPGPPLPRHDESFLRSVALRTWRFFHQFSNAETHWLIPDNLQQDPPVMAQKISPTNLGLLLNARLAAYELGFLTVEEYIHLTAATLSHAQRLPRCMGHFFNWYDTRTLQPLPPLFVSTVDSGNLAGCLVTLKQGCLEIGGQPLFRGELWQGIRDHVELVTALAGKIAYPNDAAASIRSLTQRLETLGEDALVWLRALPELEKEASTLAFRLYARLERDEELRWWVLEMLRRLQSVRSMTEALAPWVLPEYRELCEHCELQLEVGLPGLTLDALPAFMADLDIKLQKGLRDDTALPGLISAIRSLRALLPTCEYNAIHLREQLHGLAEAAGALVEEMDFRFLCNARRKLLSIGYNASDRRVEKSCYDLLASEARLATFIAIAKGDISQESWFQLGRDHTLSMGERALLSWTGTMFEYLMPPLWMKVYPNTIHAQSLHAVVRGQQQYGRNYGVPWGISESAYSDRGPQGEYLYRAFGLPALALDPNLEPDVVIAPYATCLALLVDAQNALKNLRLMHDMNWLGPFGFYEAADYRRSWGKPSPIAELTRCWMAHHQGMSLLAICNLLTHGSIQRLFHQEPIVVANERMLHEKVPRQSVVVPQVEMNRLSGASQRELEPLWSSLTKRMFSLVRGTA